MPLDRWQAADLRERAGLAQDAHDLIRERYGLTPRELEIFSGLKDGELGKFVPRTGRVVVSDRLLSEDKPYELLNTIAHENQHAAQEEIMRGRMKHPLGDDGRPEVKAWRKGERTYDHANLRGKGYAYSPLEVDANNAGAGVVDGYKDARIEALEALVATQAARLDSLEGRDERSASHNPDERPRS